MLTLNDLRKIEATFIDIFRGLFHPRIDYAKAVSEPKPEARPGNGTRALHLDLQPDANSANKESKLDGARIAGAIMPHDDGTPTASADDSVDAASTAEPAQQAEDDSASMIMEDDQPLFEVPPLPKRNGNKKPPSPPTKAQTRRKRIRHLERWRHFAESRALSGGFGAPGAGFVSRIGRAPRASRQQPVHCDC